MSALPEASKDKPSAPETGVTHMSASLTSFRTLILAVGVLVTAIAPAASAQSSADARVVDDGYSLSARALMGGDETDLYLVVENASRPGVERLEKVQLKAAPYGGRPPRTSNYFDVPVEAGVAVLHVPDLLRHQPLNVVAHVKDGRQHVLEAETIVQLRPDLVVAGVSAPADVVRQQAFAVDASIAEANGDTGATTTVSILDGPVELASKGISVAPGGEAKVVFDLALRDPGSHALRVEIDNTEPGEADTTNNGANRSVIVHRYDADGVVTTDHPLATEIGAAVLEGGGNAIDAAAAVAFALNVTQPHLCGIGGGSTILVSLADGRRYSIDAREVAPGATTPGMYAGKTMALVGPNGYAVGVPGTLRAIELMLDRWGTTSLVDALAPATDLAEHGFPVGTYLAAFTGDARAALQPETKAVFRHADGTPLKPGDWLVQPDLAKTFELIARDGSEVFYRGEIARAIVEAQRRSTTAGGEGRMTLDDLARHEVKVESPLSLDYRGYDVLGVPPSSNGGLVVLEALGLVERFGLGDTSRGLAFGDVKTVHLMLDALRLALADRDMWIGDDDVFPVPTEGLLSQGYLDARSALMSETARVPGVPLQTSLPPAGNPFPFQGVAPSAEADEAESKLTTHFSIIDKWGNAVSFTSTLADGFGSGIMVPGYGFLLNDSLINFNLDPAFNPVTGNPGANDPGPNKRAMGSTAPIIILKDGEPIALTGTLGGAFIPSVVFQVVVNLLDHHMSLQQAVDAPRFWIAVRQAAINPAYLPLVAPLRALGHNINGVPVPFNGLGAALGSASSVGVDLRTFALQGAVDPRLTDARSIVVYR
jgi:gamma-glutamyltranspeptidase/glutathione hydrolase